MNPLSIQKSEIKEGKCMKNDYNFIMEMLFVASMAIPVNWQQSWCEWTSFSVYTITMRICVLCKCVCLCVCHVSMCNVTNGLEWIHYKFPSQFSILTCMHTELLSWFEFIKFTLYNSNISINHFKWICLKAFMDILAYCSAISSDWHKITFNKCLTDDK